MNETIISGGISGAISEPLSPEARKHAKVFYEEIRHRNDDVDKIAEYTGYTQEQILRVKSYLFMEIHILSTGIRRFDPSFEIAESWQRLADFQQYVQPHDKLLIPHELMEINLIIKGTNQSKAHEQTCLTYDYPREANLFYHRLQNEKNACIGKGEIVSDGIISGGIEHKKKERNNWDRCL